MPDRAVVDEVPCAWCGGDGYVTGSMECPECTTKPRAVVAISEDRQWLVVLDPCYNTPARWKFFQRRDYAYYAALRENQIADTGQSADEVLREWLEGRDE